MFRQRKLQPCPPLPDRTVGEDDGDAFGELYARFSQRIRAYALQRLRDPDLADDITSTVFTRALANLPGFTPAQPAGFESRQLEGWLLAIARNAIIDQVRANRRLTILDPIAYRDQLIDHAQDPASAAVAPDERDQLLDALLRLTKPQQQIVLLRLQGWSGVEIDELLGMSHGAVRTAQFRAYQRLRELLTAAPVTSFTAITEPDHA